MSETMYWYIFWFNNFNDKKCKWMTDCVHCCAVVWCLLKNLTTQIVSLLYVCTCVCLLHKFKSRTNCRNCPRWAKTLLLPLVECRTEVHIDSSQGQSSRTMSPRSSHFENLLWHILKVYWFLIGSFWCLLEPCCREYSMVLLSDGTL